MRAQAAPFTAVPWRLLRAMTCTVRRRIGGQWFRWPLRVKPSGQSLRTDESRQQACILGKASRSDHFQFSRSCQQVKCEQPHQ